MIIRVATLAVILMLSSASALWAQSMPAQSQPANALAGPVYVAILEPEVLADLPANDRKVLAQTIDTLLTDTLSKQKGLVLVDRQALDKILAEQALKIGGIVRVLPGEVAGQLRQLAGSAGVLVCPTVRQVRTDKDKTPDEDPELVIDIEAVLAQKGQSLGEAHVIAQWHNHTWGKVPALDGPMQALCAELPRELSQAMANRYVEIADVHLASSLRRLQWMADDLGDALRASLAVPGVAVLSPRHPASTREERLLRVMGMATPNGHDASALLTCSPDFRLDVELAEAVGKDLRITTRF